MSTKRILVPVDFTELSDKVIEQAAAISSSTGTDMVLLHIVEKPSDHEPKELSLKERVTATMSKYKVNCECKIRVGSIFKEIPAEAMEEDYMLLIIGTHGIKGLKQKLMGSDILKLLTRVPLPSLVIQDVSPVRHNFERIVMPVGSHAAYGNIILSTALMAKIFGSEVHIFSIEKAGYEWPDSLRKNVDKAKQVFDENDIRYSRVNEKQTVLSVGYARQTLQYVNKVNADMIAIMAIPSEEYHYFAQQDKENLLTNEQGIPVLCVSGVEKD